ncbi:hypothetical protein [Rubrivirga sp. IMCC43871]|uniref:hypothetical protein n=1 Tax=Rubrivirga sp. IMCC43871 TaxID=3391575 RepID=UPI0039901AE4
MIGRLRAALAARAARTAIVARRPAPPRRVPERRLLLVLPPDDAGQAAAWALVERLGLAPARVTAVVAGDHIGPAPFAFTGRIVALDADALDWRRIPTRAVLDAAWADAPDVAVDLAAPDDLAAALLVGASPAAVRIGRHRLDREPFFDLMIGATPDAASAAEALGRLLRQLDPPVLPV